MRGTDIFTGMELGTLFELLVFKGNGGRFRPNRKKCVEVTTVTADFFHL